MNAYVDMAIVDVLAEEHKMPRELAFDLMRRNRAQNWKAEKELKSILEAWGALLR